MTGDPGKRFPMCSITAERSSVFVAQYVCDVCKKPTTVSTDLTYTVMSCHFFYYTCNMAVMPCGWGVKAGMVRVWVAGKTV